MGTWIDSLSLAKEEQRLFLEKYFAGA
jgi:hypothetical protein